MRLRVRRVAASASKMSCIVTLNPIIEKNSPIELLRSALHRLNLKGCRAPEVTAKMRSGVGPQGDKRSQEPFSEKTRKKPRHFTVYCPKGKG